MIYCDRFRYRKGSPPLIALVCLLVLFYCFLAVFFIGWVSFFYFISYKYRRHYFCLHKIVHWKPSNKKNPATLFYIGWAGTVGQSCGLQGGAFLCKAWVPLPECLLGRGAGVDTPPQDVRQGRLRQPCEVDKCELVFPSETLKKKLSSQPLSDECWGLGVRDLFMLWLTVSRMTRWDVSRYFYILLC